jgi:hypothetical protein
MSRHDVLSWLTGRTAQTIFAAAAIAPIAVAIGYVSISMLSVAAR